MQALVFKRLPLNMPKDKDEQIATKLAEENFMSVQVKKAPDLKSVCFVMKSDLYTKTHMSDLLEEELRDWEVFGK